MTHVALLAQRHKNGNDEDITANKDKRYMTKYIQVQTCNLHILDSNYECCVSWCEPQHNVTKTNVMMVQLIVCQHLFDKQLKRLKLHLFFIISVYVINVYWLKRLKHLLPLCFCSGAGSGGSGTEKGAAPESGASPAPPPTAAPCHQPQFLPELHLLLLWAASAPDTSLPGRAHQKPHVASETDALLRNQSCADSSFVFYYYHRTRECASLKEYCLQWRKTSPL